MLLIRGRSLAGGCVLLASALVGCDEFRTPVASSRASIEPSPSSPAAEVLLGSGQLPVAIDASSLGEGNYYGWIRIEDPSKPEDQITVRLLARVHSNSTILGARADPGDAFSSTSVCLSAPQRAEGATTEPQWVVPPPSEMESGVEYELEYTPPAGGSDRSWWASIEVTDDESGTRIISYGSSSTTYSRTEAGVRIKTKLIFRECVSKTAFVSLVWYDGDARKRTSPLKVQVLPVSAPTPEVYTATSTPPYFVEGTTGQYVTSMYISSLCDLPMDWALSSDLTWLEFATPTGRIGGGDPDYVTVNVFVEGIPEKGVRTATVTVTALASGRTDGTSFRLQVLPASLSWAELPPESLESGRDIRMTLTPAPGTTPNQIFVEVVGFDERDRRYTRRRSSFKALPLPDGTFGVPLRPSSCTDKSAYEVFAWASDQAAVPLSFRVTPSDRPVLVADPPVLIFDVVEGQGSNAQPLEIDVECQNSAIGRRSITTSHSWIQLAPTDTKGESNASPL